MPTNIDLLKKAADVLQTLPYRTVFIGGVTVELYLDDPASPHIRATDDVDCVMEVTSYAEYTELEEKLREHAFTQPISQDGPICRWQKEQLKFDILPARPDIIGFALAKVSG